MKTEEQMRKEISNIRKSMIEIDLLIEEAKDNPDPLHWGLVKAVLRKEKAQGMIEAFEWVLT